jgi:alpha-pyrone synthase
MTPMSGLETNTAYITSIGTAVPPHKLPQAQIADFMVDFLDLSDDELRRLKALYRNTGIAYRYSVLADYGRRKGDFTFFPLTAGAPFPSVGRRMELYREYATPLAVQAAKICFAGSTVHPTEITHLITVSCTGMYAPGPDIELMDVLGIRSSAERLAINFMGCYGAFNGMKAAAAIVKADPAAKVLMVSVELCSLHFQNKKADDFLLSNALFSDGAAAIIVESQPVPGALQLSDFASDVFAEGKEEMGWYIQDSGFEMRLTTRVPDILMTGIPSLFERILAKNKYSQADVTHYAFHPGGRRILEVLEKALNLGHSHNSLAYQVLSEFGNMSSATILFVLERLVQDEEVAGGSLVFAGAFGPGLTAETALLKIV